MSHWEHYKRINQQLWDAKVPHHVASDFYDQAAFLAGSNTLQFIELSELTEVAFRRLLHLQCHFGQDTLSWARMGAQVTGVDFSEKALAVARQSATQLGIAADFIHHDVLTLPPPEKPYDLVFTSYGVLGWLPDLSQWARVVASQLKPGGTFYMVEFHPMVWMFDQTMQKFTYSYFKTEEPIIEEVQGTYADRDAPIQLQEVGWNYSLGEVVSALTSAGLMIEFLHEFPMSPYALWPDMEVHPDGGWYLKAYGPTLPLIFSVKATLPVS